ncbi:MAG: hypothetical protein J6Z22_03290 [Lachnospiraceae bacterium]|nr:hypothetical protein [Lachnospiraceae bacterium]
MTFGVNTVILFLVLGLMFFFYVLDAPFLVYFSIPTICVYLVWEKESIPVTVTIGVSKREDGQSMDAWIQNADEKLYFGKNHGKNVVISDIPKMQD